ncbi:hypothetical protein TspCOW1_03620 [Thiohalobacter sp. COW1]|uniref:hypothetical protein n=1 Tax=Thiohalobacter sp. COW1 TaxID=2795687 RepID=UPI001915FEDE|nr:hypothetical protein [Thiohalobacter sp. COW1]BCO30259.1 hypothetical protein TspCOW1_03620 [Thiohalobacter sp. COW1]
MATEKDTEKTENQIVESESATPVGSGTRRRILKGAALTPVLLSLSSRPVLGAECTISGFMSGNVSDHGHDDCACGFTPGAWKTPDRGDGNWNHTPFDPGTCANSKGKGKGQCNSYNSDGTPFFSPGTFSGSDPHYAGKTLMQVLWLQGNQDPHQFGAHIVAALLNSYAIPGYGMSPADVQAIYANVDANGGAAAGYYMGNNGKILTVEQVVAFIQSTLCAYQ